MCVPRYEFFVWRNAKKVSCTWDGTKVTSNVFTTLKSVLFLIGNTFITILLKSLIYIWITKYMKHKMKNMVFSNDKK